MPCAMEHKPNPGHELLPGLTGRAKWAVNTSTTTLMEGKGRRGRGASGGGAVGSVSENRQGGRSAAARSEEHTSELQSQSNLVCRLLLEKKKTHDEQFVKLTEHQPASLSGS